MSLYICPNPWNVQTPRVNPKVSCGLKVIMICQCKFINCNTCPTLVGDVDNRAGLAYVGAGKIWEISVLSAQYCFESKTALKKIKSLKNLNGNPRASSSEHYF